MCLQIKNLNYPIPDSFPLKDFLYWDARNVLRIHAVQSPNNILQFLDVIHNAALTRSLTFQNSDVTPAAIAGVQRTVLWRFTKL